MSSLQPQSCAPSAPPSQQYWLLLPPPPLQLSLMADFSSNSWSLPPSPLPAPRIIASVPPVPSLGGCEMNPSVLRCSQEFVLRSPLGLAESRSPPSPPHQTPPGLRALPPGRRQLAFDSGHIGSCGVATEGTVVTIAVSPGPPGRLASQCFLSLFVRVPNFKMKCEYILCVGAM